MKKRFRIVEISRNPNCYHFRIEQQYTILFFLHWFSSPEFEPPHCFYTTDEARKCIIEHNPKAVIQNEIKWL